MSTLKVGINGFGRIGRLALRAAFDWPDMAFVAINDPGANAESLAHLLNFDSVHGRWQYDATADGQHLTVGSHSIRVTANKTIAETDWSDCNVVIESSGKMKTVEVLNGYLEQGVKSDQYSNDPGCAPQGPPSRTGLWQFPNSHNHRIRDRHCRDISGAQRSTGRPCRAGPADQSLPDGLCL
jgi:hypothetical protein